MSSPEEIPTLTQRKVAWSALTMLSIITIGALAIGLIWVLARTVSFLQPVLLPFAIAGVLAYLLEPVVGWLCKRKIKRIIAVGIVFATFGLVGIVGGIWLAPQAYRQTVGLAKRLPAYAQSAEKKVTEILDHYDKTVVPLQLPDPSTFPVGMDEPPASQPTPSPDPASLEATPDAAPQTDPAEVLAGSPDKKADAEEHDKKFLGRFDTDDLAQLANAQIPKIEQLLPELGARAWGFVSNSVGGFLGAFGFLLSMVIVPIYLFFFLLESPTIARQWGEMVPLRKSALKSEVVSVVTQINGYLIAFFRGQLLVSMIDGAVTGIALLIMGLDFALLIGLLVAVLGLIPYLGIVLALIPALLIAFVQYNDWQHPLVVVVIFLAVQNLDGIFIAPKIVGDSVGLHPLTIIMSVFFWSLLLGGLLGAILAVPLSATIKVLLYRYVWQKRLVGPSPPG